MHEISRNDFTTGEAFFLYLRNAADNQILAGCAARFYDLGDERLSRYLARTSDQQYGRRNSIEKISAPVDREIFGKIVYLGELQFQEGYRGQRAILYSFVKSLIGLSALHWKEFDWMYAFLPERHTKLAFGYGFRWFSENAVTWRQPEPVGRESAHWMAALNRHQFLHSWCQS